MHRQQSVYRDFQVYWQILVISNNFSVLTGGTTIWFSLSVLLSLSFLLSNFPLPFCIYTSSSFLSCYSHEELRKEELREKTKSCTDFLYLQDHRKHIIQNTTQRSARLKIFLKIDSAAFYYRVPSQN
jgi:hypothetical protein